MHKIAARTIFATVAAVSLCLTVVTTASAAPADVSFPVTSTGNTVDGTFINNANRVISCEWFVFANPYVPGIAVPQEDVLHIGASFNLAPGASDRQSSSVLPIGEEVFVEWACFDQNEAGGDFTEVWGSPVVASAPSGDYMPTAPAVAIVVGSTPDQTCTGSACLPTGSFGF